MAPPDDGTSHGSCSSFALLVPSSRTVTSGRDFPPAGFQPCVQPRRHCASQASLAFRGVPHVSTCALPVRNPCRGIPDDVTRAQKPHDFSCKPGYAQRIGETASRAPRSERVAQATRSFTHTLAWRTRPIQIHNFQPNFCPSAGSACIHRGRFRTGFYSRRRAPGGLVRSTARTSHALPCESGTVIKTATAATRPLSLVWRRLRRNSTHALPRHGTRERVRGIAMKTAPDRRQGPCSGRSCFGNRAGFAQQRA